MTGRTCLAIVLAAGEGTRMRSSRPKVLHAIAGRSLLAHVLAALEGAGSTHAAVVVGPDHDTVAAEVRAGYPKADVFIQNERRGTAPFTFIANDHSDNTRAVWLGHRVNR